MIGKIIYIGHLETSDSLNCIDLPNFQVGTPFNGQYHKITFLNISLVLWGDFYTLGSCEAHGSKIQVSPNGNLCLKIQIYHWWHNDNL